jgi:hypothetical protein
MDNTGMTSQSTDPVGGTNINPTMFNFPVAPVLDASFSTLPTTLDTDERILKRIKFDSQHPQMVNESGTAPSGGT